MDGLLKNKRLVAVCGSRDGVAGVEACLGGFYLHGKESLVIVTGGCRGVDQQALDWARKAGVQTKVFPADWAKYGRAAGPIRNAEMADYCDSLVAFSGGRGTASCVAEFRKRNKPVLEVHKATHGGRNYRGKSNGIHSMKTDSGEVLQNKSEVMSMNVTHEKKEEKETVAPSPEPQVKFRTNWGGMMDWKTFYSIRKSTPEKARYYQGLVGRDVRTVLNGKAYGTARLDGCTETTLASLDDAVLHKATYTRSRSDAYTAMSRFGMRPDDKVLLLVFKNKVHQAKLGEAPPASPASAESGSRPKWVPMASWEKQVRDAAQARFWRDEFRKFCVEHPDRRSSEGRVELSREERIAIRDAADRRAWDRTRDPIVVEQEAMRLEGLLRQPDWPDHADEGVSTRYYSEEFALWPPELFQRDKFGRPGSDSGLFRSMEVYAAKDRFGSDFDQYGASEDFSDRCESDLDMVQDSLDLGAPPRDMERPVLCHGLGGLEWRDSNW